MKNYFLIFTAFLFLFSLQNIFAEVREWSDTNGKKLKAEIVFYGKDYVVAKRDDGKSFRIPFERFCEKDLDYIKNKYQDKLEREKEIKEEKEKEKLDRFLSGALTPTQIQEPRKATEKFKPVEISRYMERIDRFKNDPNIDLFLTPQQRTEKLLREKREKEKAWKENKKIEKTEDTSGYGFPVRSNYEKVCIGMSKSKVMEILGREDCSQFAESGFGNYRLEVWTWSWLDFGGGVISITFSNGSVSAKSQIGL